MAIGPARSARERVDGQRAPGGTVQEDDLDQLPLWLEGAYIRMPLRMETVREDFPHRMELAP